MDGDSQAIDVTYTSNLFRTVVAVELPTVAIQNNAAKPLSELASLEIVKFNDLYGYDQSLIGAFRSELPNVVVEHPVDEIMAKIGTSLNRKPNAVTWELIDKDD